MEDIVPDFSEKSEPLFRSPKKIIEDGEKAITTSLHKELNARLLDCTEKQREFFHRIFPNVKSLSGRDKLITAIDLLHRTITKNLKEERADIIPVTRMGQA